jgi:hypothetical protein
MKRRLLYAIAMMAAMVTSVANAGTVVDTGEYGEGGGTIVSESPYSGIFTDIVAVDVDKPGRTVIFDGDHTGMAGEDILLTNTSDSSSYHLGTTFSEALSLGVGSYVFTVSGFAMNALDSKVMSNYNLEVTTVPLPAAVWLFGSALVGFISFSARRKI